MGIGKKLLEMCCKEALNKKFKKIKLEVNKENSNAIKFYKSKGFYIVSDAGEFSFYMVKDLIERE